MRAWVAVLLVGLLAGCTAPAPPAEPEPMGDAHGPLVVDAGEPRSRPAGGQTWRVDDRTTYSNGVADAQTASVRLRGLNGPIILLAAPNGSFVATVTRFAFGENETDAQAHLEALNVTMEESLSARHLDIRIEIDAPADRQGAGGTITLALPPWLWLEADITNSLGPITSLQLGGGHLQAETIKGSILVSGAWDGLDLSTAAAPIDVTTEPHREATYDVRNVDGPITMRLNASAAYAVNATGSTVDVRLEGASTDESGVEVRGTDFAQSTRHATVRAVSGGGAVTVYEGV